MKKNAITAIKGKKGQHLNQREVNAISEGAIDGLLLFDVEANGYKVNLTYNTDGLIPYFDFLRFNSMNRRLILVLLRNVVLVLKEIENNCFSKDLLMWNIQSVYVEPSTWHVYMMYVPLQFFETIGNLKTFLLDTIALCHFESGEDTEYIQRLVQDLNRVTAYTTGMLESYCDRLSEEIFQQKKKNVGREVCQACGLRVIAEEEICPFCGKRLKSQTINTHPKEELVIDSGRCFIANESEMKAEKSHVFHKSISINEDENGVITVFRGTQPIVQSVWLEDYSREGKIFITKFPFRIGKMEGVTDYQICNNAVSRKHADILKEQGRYFIIDLGSTNGTYLNEKRIQPGVKELLTDGMLVEFANSKYKIHID